MKGKFILFTLTGILLLPAASEASAYSGRGLYLFGDSAVSMGRGGTGVSSPGTEFQYLNPASLGAAERFSFSQRC